MLFLTDCYIYEFTANIIEIGEDHIVLDATYFYPQGGGQPGDTGTIGDVRITDTKKRDGKIMHFFDGDCNLAVGQSVACAIDWQRRHTHMRIHSASHVMEYFLHQVCGELGFLSSFISGGKDTSSYEVTGDGIKPEHIQKIQDLSNEFIKAGHDITLYADENNPEYRYWQCAQMQFPCGGTHPKNTAEIGEIVLKVKGQASLGKQKVVTTLV